MLIIDQVIIPEVFVWKRFSCCYRECGSACCILGDCGAALLHDEVLKINNSRESIMEHLDDEIREYVRGKAFCIETGGLFSTACLDDTGRCIFTVKEKSNRVTCLLEEFRDPVTKKTLRPVSCRLFPIRVYERNGLFTLGYEKWESCATSWDRGRYLVDFCSPALCDQFGKGWVDKLEGLLKQKRL